MNEAKLLVTPQKKIWWCQQSAGPSFFRQLDSRQIEAFITGRDIYGASRIGRALIEVMGDKTLKLDDIDDDPVFDIGEDGCFDENGVSYPWIITHADKEYMFYVGWVEGGKNRFQNYLGLAVRSKYEHGFKRVSKAPIIDRSDKEPYGIGSCCVVRDSDQWVMLYTSFLPWNREKNTSKAHPHSQPSYNIKMATSKDLINWERTNKTIISFRHGEHIHGKPVLTKNSQKQWELYFSARGEAYRIAHAIGDSILKLERKDNLAFSKADWISTTQEYAFPLTINKTSYLFFNGNGYGRSGLGYSILERA